MLDAYRVTYTYDGMGNRLSAVESAGARTTSVYDGANQLLTAQTGTALTTYSYDGNGNQTGQNALGALTTYTWDEENRLTGIAYPTGALSTYVYSADGLRRKREESGQSLLEVWDGTQLLQEKDAITKAEVTRYLLQNSSYSGLRAQRQASDGIWRYFAYDVQGNTRKLLNSDGTSALDLLFRAFGQKQASSGAGSTLMQFGAYYGYEWDADSRMWVKARHLSGTQGHWLNQDPIGFDGGDWNLWRYVGNNAVTFADPRGLDSQSNLTTPALRITKISSRINHPCGSGFSSQVRFDVNAAFSPTETFVIQHTRIKLQITDCQGRSIPHHDFDFYESWPVTKPMFDRFHLNMSLPLMNVKHSSRWRQSFFPDS